MKVSRHERALRAELKAMEEAYADMAADARLMADRVEEMRSRIELLQRILEAGRATTGEESE